MRMDLSRRAALALPMLLALPARAQSGPRFEAAARFNTPAARQGVCADAEHVYVVDDRLIVKVAKQGFREVARFETPREGPIIHMNSLSLHEGRVHAAHSNYPEEPMLSSVEIFDSSTLRHVGSHSFGFMPGSLTTFEWHEGAWWAIWANYSRVFGRNQRPYGNTHWTHMTRLAPDMRQTAGWSFPVDVLMRAEPMSISGASWGPGLPGHPGPLLWCTGHDHKEVYALRLPRQGMRLERVATLAIEAEGQAIAWDKSDPTLMWMIVRSKREVVGMRLALS
ncbi:MAG TPA: hypothetical protein VD970_20240 [Acetobacteraceae bacterium]|nr:hypothetical protein [Acetobacteraceae bacterium]